LDFSDLGSELLCLIGRTAPVLLEFGIVAAGGRMLEVDCEKQRGIIPVRLKPPDGRLPEGGAIPITMHEEERTGRLGESIKRQE
jgi:hypothetical protein